MSSSELPPRLFAFVDESQSVRALDPHTYILAATLCREPGLSSARDAMRRLRLQLGLSNQLKVHWHRESEIGRRLIIQAVAATDLHHIAVIYEGRADERSERLRRHCLERLLYELEQKGASRIILESRGTKDDERDRTMFRVLRARKVVSSGSRLWHATGPSDALLWIPDAVCGAITRNRLGNSAFVDALGDRLTVVTLLGEA